MSGEEGGGGPGLFSGLFSGGLQGEQQSGMQKSQGIDADRAASEQRTQAEAALAMQVSQQIAQAGAAAFSAGVAGEEGDAAVGNQRRASAQAAALQKRLHARSESSPAPTQGLTK